MFNQNKQIKRIKSVCTQEGGGGRDNTEKNNDELLCLGSDLCPPKVIFHSYAQKSFNAAKTP